MAENKNSLYFATGKMTALFVASLALAVLSFSTVKKDNSDYQKFKAENIEAAVQSGSEILIIANTIESNSSNTLGQIYSSDGIPMLDNINLTTGECFTATDDSNGLLYYASDYWMAPVVGYTYSGSKAADSSNRIDGVDYAKESAGMLSMNTIMKLLTANDLPSNQQNRRGNSIVTTIFSKAQKCAVDELSEYNGQDGNGYGTLAVVNYDGAILVNAANISDRNFKEFHDEKGNFISNSSYVPRYCICEKNAFDSLFIGSSFKPIIARILINNDNLFDNEWSVIRNDAFKDVAHIMSDTGISVHNYQGYHEGNKSLSLALIQSSNTYFFRHCQKLGLEYVKQELGKLMLFDDFSIHAGTLTGLSKQDNFSDTYGVLPAKSNHKGADDSDEYILSYDGDQYDCYMTYGQAAGISPIREAAAYNHILSGDFYMPFEIFQIRTPENNIIYNYIPEVQEEHHMDIDMSNDYLINGMADTFESYISKSNSIKSTYPNDLLYSRRLLAKSGTAVINNDKSMENRTMALALLNEDRTSVICTAVIAVKNRPAGNTISNAKLIEHLMQVLNSMEVL